MKREMCPFCNKKSVGVDKTGFKSCAYCEYDSDYYDRKIDLHKKVDMRMDIYNELICDNSNNEVRFICLCNKFKGHKGKHKDNQFPEFQWEDEK